MMKISNPPLAFLALILSTFLSLANASPSAFTPAAMLSAPRRSTALPNSDGTLALYTTSEYNFTTHEHTYGTWVLETGSGGSTLWSNSSAIGEVHWLGDAGAVFWTVGEDDGTTSFWVGEASGSGE